MRSPAAMAHAPVDTVGMVTDGEDGGLVVEGVHLLGEEPTNGAEQQAADPEGVLPLAALNQSSNLACFVPLHEHPPKHGEAAQLRVVRVGRHHGCRVRSRPRGGGGGAAGGPVPAERNHPGLVEVAEHRLVLEDRGVCVMDLCAERTAAGQRGRGTLKKVQ